MKTTFFSTLSAIALSGLALTLAPTTASAHDYCRGSHFSRSCHSLPHGCRSVNYRGRHCWYGGGHYYGWNPLGGYVIVDQPVVEQEYVAPQPVSEDDVAVSYLPEGCSTVYVGGERCWFHDGCYYRHCGHGYTRFHCHDRSYGRSCSSRGHERCSRGHRESCSRGHYSSCHSGHGRR